MKLGVYAVVKNEEKNIERFMQAIKSELGSGDDFLILDTGSTDDTIPALARERDRAEPTDAAFRTPRWHRSSIRPWRFDVAKNTALALLDWAVDLAWLLDADEVPAPGWRQAIEDAYNANPTANQFRYKFVWSHNPDGTDGYVFYADKMHSRFGWQWKGIAHEWPVTEGEVRQAFIPGLEVHHFQDQSINRTERDLELMTRTVAELPDDARVRFYYARQLLIAGKKVDASLEFQKYLEHPKANWRHERSEAMLFLAQVGGNEAWDHQWLYRAIAECPERREVWVDTAKFEHRRGNSAIAMNLLKQALERPKEFYFLSRPDCDDDAIVRLATQIRKEQLERDHEVPSR